MPEPQNLADKIVNAALAPFGRYRVRLGEWPDDKVAAAIAAIKERGGTPDGEGGAFPGVDDYYFQLPQGRIKISVFEFSEAYLWGPRRLVRELAAQIAA